MRGAILTVAGGVFSLILSANQGYAGAAKTGCTTITPGMGTPNVCGVMAPTGTQQVDPPGNIDNPDTTFVINGPINFSDIGSATGNSTSFSTFLDGTTFSGGFDGSQVIANSVLEFDGTFGRDANFTICFNAGSSVQLYVDGSNIDLADGEATCDDPAVMGTSDLDTGTFILDYYTGAGVPGEEDPNFLEFQINGADANDTLPGGTVPEPASLSLLAAGLAGVGLLRRRRKRG